MTAVTDFPYLTELQEITEGLKDPSRIVKQVRRDVNSRADARRAAADRQRGCQNGVSRG